MGTLLQILLIWFAISIVVGLIMARVFASLGSTEDMPIPEHVTYPSNDETPEEASV